MKTTTCLIIEPSDRTTDGNIRKEAFEALCNAPIVIEGARVIKCELASAPVAVVAAPRRPRSTQATKAAPDAPQAPTAPVFTPEAPPSFDDISSES